MKKHFTYEEKVRYYTSIRDNPRSSVDQKEKAIFWLAGNDLSLLLGLEKGFTDKTTPIARAFFAGKNASKTRKK